MTAAQLLLGSTAQLSISPRSPEAKYQLLESAKLILSGTTAILSSVDDSEVRKMLKLSSLISERAAILRDDMRPENATMLVQVIMQVTQLTQQLGQLGNKRLGELLNGQVQVKLKTELAVIAREPGLLVTACKLVLSYPNSQKCVTAKNDACNRIINACGRIAELVEIKEDIDFLARAQNKRDLFAKQRNLEDVSARLRNTFLHGHVEMEEVNNCLQQTGEILNDITAAISGTISLCCLPRF